MGDHGFESIYNMQASVMETLSSYPPQTLLYELDVMGVFLSYFYQVTAWEHKNAVNQWLYYGKNNL